MAGNTTIVNVDIKIMQFQKTVFKSQNDSGQQTKGEAQEFVFQHGH